MLGASHHNSRLEIMRAKKPSRVQVALSSLAICTSFGCATSPKPVTTACTRAELVEVALTPHPQLNPDREGYPRSVIVRVYQLDGIDDFEAATYDELWQAESPPEGASGATELILVPGAQEVRKIPRSEKATHLAVAAKFREHTGSGWRATRAIPPPLNACESPPPRMHVDLIHYTLHLR